MQVHTLDENTLETLGHMFIDIGKISALHQRKMDLRHHFRKLLKEASSKLKEANDDRQSLSMYEDCGDFYENSYYEARGVSSGILQMKKQLIRLEKYQKLCTHSFKETYPSVCFKLLEQEIEKVTNETNQYFISKQK